MQNAMKKPKLLLINPYIYDFAAYDLWSKPLGLLYLAGVLEENGCEIIFLDAMDRWHPDVLKLQNRTFPKSKRYGDGHFHKETVLKPPEFSHVRRHYSRYGMSPEVLRTNLGKIRAENRIDAILVTSGMTYWYSGVHEAIAYCREFFPRTRIFLGGIYATLFTEFAKNNSGADFVLKGEGEQPVLKLISELLRRPLQKHYSGYDDYPLPAYHLYPKLDYVAMMSSRGCPYSCSFCATHEFTELFSRRKPEKVFREIEHYVSERHIKNITFYDDALFVNAENHIKPILRMVIAKRLAVHFHTPNGLFAKLLDEELAELLVESGFKTIRLSYETKNANRQEQMRKVSDDDLEKALRNLEQAGFPKHEAVVYLIMGLPHQKPSEVEESIRYVHGLGARVSLSSFSPIPHTPEWEIAVHQLGFPADRPLLTNKSTYPLRSDHFTEMDFERLKSLGIEANKELTPDTRKAELEISDYNVYA
jgi:pyruvate-formate lyase-activating enzyme